MANSSAKTRDILIVGPSAGSPELQNALKAHLNHAFRELPGSPIEWSFAGIESPQQLASTVSLSEVPLLVILDPSGPLQETAPWEALCRGLRQLDPLSCILVLQSSKAPSAEESIRWLDRGASGLFNILAPTDSTEDALRDMLSKPLRVKVPRKVRMSARHKIEIQLASFEQALVAETLNIGVGGLFIRSVPQGLAVGDEVEFVLQFTPNVSGQASPENSNPLVSRMNDDSSPSANAPSIRSEIRGNGSVVWVRSAPVGNEPEGFGLQFKEVESEGFKKLQEFIASHRIQAFIPKA